MTLLWADHTWSVVDFRPIIARGGDFERLKAPELFSQVEVIDRGEAIGGPGEIEFHADTLHRAAATSGAAAE